MVEREKEGVKERARERERTRKHIKYCYIIIYKSVQAIVFCAILRVGVNGIPFFSCYIFGL